MQGMGVMLLQPLVGVEIKVLLTPEHPREGLAHDAGAVAIGLDGRRGDGVIKLVCLLEPLLHHGIECPERIAQLAWRCPRQTEPDHLPGSRADGQLIIG